MERWLGAVEAVTVEPIAPFPVARLAEVVQKAAQGWSGDRWALMEGWHGDRRLLAAIRHPLHRVDHPLFDQHVEIRLPYRDLLPDGLPGEQAVVDLRRSRTRSPNGWAPRPCWSGTRPARVSA